MMTIKINSTITIMPKKKPFRKKKIFPPSARKLRRAATVIQAAFRGWQSRAPFLRWRCNKSGCYGGQAFEGETDGLLYCSPECAGWSDEEEMECCVKCDEKSVVEKGWAYCDTQGWFCPSCSPTSSCDDERCNCCYGFGDIEIDLDEYLYKKNLDWGFDKPESGNYLTVYIFNKDEE